MGLSGRRRALTSIATSRNHEWMSTEEAPGGSVGCDVCGILLASNTAPAHRAWHRDEEQKLERLSRLVQELLEEVRGKRI